MKSFRLLFSFISILVLTCIFCSCTPTGQPPVVEGGKDLTILQNGVTEYRFVYPEDMSSAERSVLAGLRSHLKNTYNTDIPMVTDKEAPQEKEILFGNTNRTESAEAVKYLANEADFSFSVSGNKLVIAWISEFAARRAADYVKTTCRETSEWIISAGTRYVESVNGSTPKPVSAFSFEEGSGTTAKDTVTGKDATLVNGKWANGISGQGIFLDDSSTGYLNLGTGYLKDLCKGAEAITINLWVMAYQNRASRLFSFYTEGSVTASYCLYHAADLYFYVRSTPSEALKRDQYLYDAGSEFITGTGGNKTNEAVWQNLTFVMDFAKGEIEFYVNGQKISGENGYKKGFASSVFNPGTPSATDALGGDPTGKSFSFCGILDEFKVYDSRLTDEQILALASSYSDKNSPTADQTLLNTLCKKLRGDFALAEGAALYCSQSKQLPLDPQNPTAAVQVKNGKWYVPRAFALTAFGEATVNTLSPTEDGYDLEELCAKASKKLLISNTYKTAVISASAIWTEEGDATYLARLYALLTEHSYDLPETSVETTRIVVADATTSSVIRHCFSPYIIKMGDALYATMDTHTRSTLVFRSDDGGNTFTQLSIVSPMAGGSLFEAGGNLYLLGMTGKETTEIGITKSTDGGKTWSAITTVPYDVANKYCAPSAVIKANGRIYKAFEGYKTSAWTEDKRTYTVSAPENADLLNPNSWTVSTHYSYGIDDLMAVTDQFYTDKTYIQEGCLVLMADGTIRNVLRIDCYPYYGGAVSMLVSPDGKTQSYDKNDPLALIGLPTGGDLFHIEYDAVSGYYVSLINVKTTDHRPYQRNVLALAVSKDLENWEIVTNLLTDRSVTNEYISMAMHGFQYVSFCFDGNDLLFLVREAGEKADNYHDNDLLTFYRLENFRNLYVK